ncbi:MAG: 2-oxo acid dehydrogenase subunit E2 [Firmicutes bacterium]|nr:2-oxo acid dehydrogenase subunit E2 [Bacillota bacterium]
MAFGDRRDGKRVKAPGLQTVMTALLPQRTGCEVYLNDKIDATELIKYLEKKNEGRTERKMTIFHCAITALARMLMERPTMNRFIQGWAVYERNEISLSFVARRTFVDGSAEARLYFVPKPTDTVNELSEWIMGEVKETRKSEVATGGVDELLDKFAAMPRFLMAFLVRIIRYLDFWGINPKFITDGDPNYSSILVSNLGSIKCPSVYHHLNNYGTNSVMVTIGTLHKEEMLMDDGHKEIRDVIDIGATIDERIGDGFYFARSLKLVKHIFAHPELLEQPLNVPSGFDYK